MKKLQLLLLAALAFANADAQKLPNKQQASVRIPSNLKIDGKATEWDNKFQAYNKTNDFFYTIANNNDELYLVIQTSDHNVFNKVIDRGLTLSVKNPETGKTANFTFPTAVANIRNGRLSTFLSGYEAPVSGKVFETGIIANNKILKDKHRFIKVDGVDGVDTLLSVYNENGIRAAEQFDNNRVYTLEMAVTLKLIGLSSNNETKILYKLKVNPTEYSFDPDRYVIEPGLQIPPDVFAKLQTETAAKMGKTFGGTDFEGEYTLAK